tara:strand:+ start:129 stop:734 length:606 start_codon:yes stop_codon:yes gene_type:complete
MDNQSIVILAFACVSGAISPGPSLALVIKNTIDGGRTQGILTGIGHGLGLTIYAFGAVMGLSSIFVGNQRIYAFIQILGSLWLAYIGFMMIKSSSSTFQSRHIRSKSSGFLDGFMISFLNPKILIFFVAVFSQFIHEEITNYDKAVFVAIAGMIDTMWYVLVAATLAKSKLLVKLKANTFFIDKIIGSILICISISILLKV